MAKTDTRMTVLGIINEVRGLLGFNTVENLDDDKHALVLLRLLNTTIAEISDFGDWQEMYTEIEITAQTSVQTYELGIFHPLKNIYEISFHNDGQALYPETKETINRYVRNGGTGRPRFFTLKYVDNQGNPKFTVHPQPGTNENGLTFTVCYFKKPPLYTISSADDEVDFPANVVIQGLYAKSLVEEAGGPATKEAMGAEMDFRLLMNEALNRWNADVGTDIYLVPRR